MTYQAYGVVVELDGRVAHPEESRWRDIRRDNASIVNGQKPLRYGWADVTEWPCQVAADVGAVLSGRGWDGRLRRCGCACQLPARFGVARPPGAPPGSRDRLGG